MLPHDKKQLPIAAPHDQSVLYGLKKFSSTPGVAPQERDRAKNPCELCGILARPFTGCPRRLAQPVDRRVVPRVRPKCARATRLAEESHWAAPGAPAGARHASMASQLARLAGRTSSASCARSAATARRRAQGGQRACIAGAQGGLKYFRTPWTHNDDGGRASAVLVVRRGVRIGHFNVIVDPRRRWRGAKRS